MNDVVIVFLSELAEGILLAFVPVLVSMITAWLLAKARMAWAQYKEANANYSWLLESIAVIAVKAAEQSKIAGLIEDKKSYAVQVAQQWLNDKGFSVDLAIIEAAIEAAVFEEINKANK